MSSACGNTLEDAKLLAKPHGTKSTSGSCEQLTRDHVVNLVPSHSVPSSILLADFEPDRLLGASQGSRGST